MQEIWIISKGKGVITGQVIQNLWQVSSRRIKIMVTNIIIPFLLTSVVLWKGFLPYVQWNTLSDLQIILLITAFLIILPILFTIFPLIIKFIIWCVKNWYKYIKKWYNQFIEEWKNAVENTTQTLDVPQGELINFNEALNIVKQSKCGIYLKDRFNKKRMEKINLSYPFNLLKLAKTPFDEMLEEDIYLNILCKFLEIDFLQYNDFTKFNNINKLKLNKFLWHEYTLTVYSVSIQPPH